MLFWKAVISIKMGIRLLKPLQCLKQMGWGVELRFGPVNSIKGKSKLKGHMATSKVRDQDKDSTDRLMLGKSTNTGKLPTQGGKVGSVNQVQRHLSQPQPVYTQGDAPGCFLFSSVQSLSRVQLFVTP